jgi:hypothetical protein
MLYEDPNDRLNTEGILNFIEEQFELSEDGDQNSIGSSLTISKTNKTVNSFLLSKGMSNSEQSLQESQ